MTCWVVGDLVWDAYAYLRGAPAASFADVLYLAGYPLLALGIVRILVLRTPGRYPKGCSTVCAFAIRGSHRDVGVPRRAHDRRGEPPRRGRVGAYPFADVLLLAAVAWLVLTPGPASTPSLLLMFFLSTTLILDLLWTALPLINERVRSRRAERGLSRRLRRTRARRNSAKQWRSSPRRRRCRKAACIPRGSCCSGSR